MNIIDGRSVASAITENNVDTFFTYTWVGYLAVAGYLTVSRKGNLLLVLGLVGLALGSLRFALLRWGVVEVDEMREYTESFRIISAASVVLLLLGVIVLAMRQGKTTSGLLGASAENVATLIVPRTQANSYSRAEALRDAAFELIMARAQAEQLKVVEQKSNPYSAEVWLRVDYLLPESDPNVSLRAFVAITVERHDFHRFENLFTVETRVGTQVNKLTGVIAIDEDAVTRLHRHITTPGVALVLPRRVRQWGWQLWRPANRMTRIRPDWAMAGAVIGAILLGIVPVIGPLLLVLAFVALYVWGRRRRTFVLTSGRPLNDPRRLRWMDSWQVTVGGLARAAQSMSAQVKMRVLAGAPEALALNVERNVYWSIDGQVKRDQIAIRYRRALGFIHLVPYGENLYVGWECHLNSAAWAESAVARGVDRVTGRLVHANRVVSGEQGLNEYDVADSNFLSEWLHEAIKRELMLQIAEHKIDQQIDFSIQRESRKEALQGQTAAQSEKKPAARNRFMRTA